MEETYNVQVVENVLYALVPSVAETLLAAIEKEQDEVDGINFRFYKIKKSGIIF